jgi:hypothetical protein
MNEEDFDAYPDKQYVGFVRSLKSLEALASKTD